jgi:FAD:protein FMN transferase
MFMSATIAPTTITSHATENPYHEIQVNAMGTQCHIIVVIETQAASVRLLSYAHQRIAALEQMWSRFRSDSDISKLNASPGKHVAISEETMFLLQFARSGWKMTNGAFDPTVHASMMSLGYDRSIIELEASDLPAGAVSAAPGCEGIEINRNLRTAKLAAGVSVDVGGIGKGLAADVLYEELRHMGALGASVSMGGDVRVGGLAPNGIGWPIGIGDPGDHEMLIAEMHLSEGAMVTTTPFGRSWMRNGERLHHLLDPRTGRPVQTDVQSVTVICGEAWLGEVIAKHAVLEPGVNAIDVISAHGAEGVVVKPTHRETTPGFGAYVLSKPPMDPLSLQFS